jgi:hypothetical protein
MRVPDWREKLHAEIDASRTREGNWSDNDCLRFCARCVLAMTGIDYALPWASVDSEGEAMAALERSGGISGLLTDLFGEALPPNLARAGDVVLAEVGGLQSAGICTGVNCAFVTIPRGLVIVSREAISAAWRID